MSDTDLGKLNRYMGGTGDAEEFLTPREESGKDLESQRRTASQTYTRAVNAIHDINALRTGFGLTFDQAVQIYLIGKHDITIDPISFPPVTERRKGE